VTAITNLVYAKQAVIDLFRGAGVPMSLLQDFQDQLRVNKDAVKKAILARTAIQRMNEAGDADWAVRMRRELVRRVVEWKDYTTCPPNCGDIARGAVAAVKEIVGQYDFVTEIRQERDRLTAQNLRKVGEERQALAQKVEELDSIKTEFCRCFGLSNPQERGRAFERVMNHLFAHEKMEARESFTLRNTEGVPLEQIDGSIALEGYVYLIEIKWWEEPVGQKEMGAFGMKVFGRNTEQVRGIFISASPYTPGAVESAQFAFSQKRPILLMTLKEFFDALQANTSVRQLILDRVRLMLDEKRITP
jgi:restriction system protein